MREKGSGKVVLVQTTEIQNGDRERNLHFYFTFPAEICIIYGQLHCESWHPTSIAPGQTHKAGCTQTRVSSSPSSFPNVWEPE